MHTRDTIGYQRYQIFPRIQNHTREEQRIPMHTQGEQRIPMHSSGCQRIPMFTPGPKTINA